MLGRQALGRIDLGAATRLDGPGAPLTGALLSQRPPRLECNPHTPYQVRVDGGQAWRRRRVALSGQ
ncbi:spore coat U domain-containing protein [Pseudomonas putida S11]|nr:spore coat U domain-containing protein [Pseudomonas putida S11]